LFFELAGGWIGVTPGHVLPGDLVVIVFGSRVPFVLRQYGQGYRLISDCYIDGMMHGKAIELWKDGKLTDEEFEIC
jgi:hypothetical protein